MQIEHRKISELIGYAHNARTHSDEQIVEIMESIKEFGFNDPIEIDSDGVILSGHARLEAAQRLGMVEVPTLCHAHLSDVKRRAYILAANRIQMNAGWDADLLRHEFLQLIDDEFDIKLTGFTQEEIDDYLIALEPDEEVSEDVPALEEDTQVEQGQVWRLGEHRLMCGDSTNAEQCDLLLRDLCVGLVFSDPPYNLDSASVYKALQLSEAEHFVLIATFRQLAELYSIDPQFKFRFDFVLDAKVPKSFMNEKMPYFTHQNGAYFTMSDTDETIFNNKHAKGIRGEKAYWATIVESPRNTNAEHGHAKNVQGTIETLCAFKNEGYVYDPFAGSGTTLAACHALRRHCVLMELEPKFCDVIIRRWQKLTNQKAINETTGELYNG